MTLRKLLNIVFGLLIVLAVVIGLIAINHPIILKWVTGAAKHHGQPISATIYANGQVTDNIHIYYTDEANSYLISLKATDSTGMLQFFHLDLNTKSIGKPIATTKNDYDIIGSHLFQSESAVHFRPIQDYAKGFQLGPQVTFTDEEIRFKMPLSNARLDSVRIVLP